MSAKWRALQHRHRYTYNAVVFPQHFIQALNQTSRSSAFFLELKHLISLNSTYLQLEHVKNVASAFLKLLSDPTSEENIVSSAVKLYLEILFLENSLPLHRTLASALTKCKTFQSLIEACFRQLCELYGRRDNVGYGKRFCVSRVALSMMSTPKLGYLVEVVEQCAVSVGLDVVSGLNSVVSEMNEWSRPSPLVMEQCQEALSCMYYLLQRFPAKFRTIIDGSNLVNRGVLEMAFMTILTILKSQAFSRDCFVSAGVSLCAALQVCLSSDELGLFIMRAVFHQDSILNCKIELPGVVRKIPFKDDLIGEISQFSAHSRLCLIRGILTTVPRAVLDTHFVVSNDDLNGVSAFCDDGYAVKTILYDAILPELCNYAENPVDSHSNFHALTVMQICLQQMKTLLQSGASGVIDNYDPVPDEMGARILKIVWCNLEDPLSQTVKQAHLIFDLYVDVQSCLKWADGSENIKLFLKKIASDLLDLGPRCKGRYVPLATLTTRMGARSILDINSNLLFETTKAYIDDDVCCAATTFLKCFLECLRDEFWSSFGVEGGYEKYRGTCLLPFLRGLASGDAKLRSNLNTYALPVLLDLDVDSVFSMFALIGICQGGESPFFASEITFADFSLEFEHRVAVLVSLLKVSRGLALMEGDVGWCEGSLLHPDSLTVLDMDMDNSDFQCVVVIKGIEVKIPVMWFILALSHIDESLRMDAAETLFLNPKTSSLPSSLELSLMRRAVPLNMRCCSTSFQMKWNSMFRKFFSRVRTALERQLKLGTWKPIVSADSNGVCLYTEAEKIIEHRANDLLDFMKWLSCFLFFSCYPSAPYERKIMAMELILIMLNVWPLVRPSLGNQEVVWSETNLHPYSKGFTLPNSTLLLVGSVIDSWDQLRLSSFRILLLFPTPLPGICCPDVVQEAIMWAKKLVCSPRVRESDAGALIFRLLFRKYVLELGWILRPSCNNVLQSPKPGLMNGASQNDRSSTPVLTYMISLIDWLLVAVEDAEENLREACENSFVHGILLTLRYTFEELDWSSIVVTHISETKHALERLLELVMRITSLALWVVSADAWYLPDDMEDMVDDDSLLLDIQDETDSSGIKIESEVTSKSLQEGRPSEQTVMVGCWLAMKEVSLLLGTVVRKVPLPTPDEKGNIVGYIGDEFIVTSGAILDVKQLETVGNHFLEVLLKMKHNGAIDKTRAGFTALCNHLLCSNDSRLCKLTESWMDQLMERTVSKGQTVDDLLRRSAGIPAAFIAFFLAEPEGTPKRLLPRALRWLIDIVQRSLTELPGINSSKGESGSVFSSKSSPETGCIQLPKMNGGKEMSKVRDEGVVPTVHAFNVLRATFNDANLATDTSGFSAEALIMSIQSFSSPYWEVRNSACLSYTALLRRMIGFLNVQKRESARRSLTGLEFFHRYPALHSFLFNELQAATEFLVDGSSRHVEFNLKNDVHPSLCPMLILLSRLKPSPIMSDSGDALDPFLFMPFIQRCSVQSNFRIRLLASRALTGLVSNEKLKVVLLKIASELHSHIMNPDFNSIHGVLLQLNALVDTNCRNLSDSSKKDEILLELFKILATCSWIARPPRCPCPTLNCCLLEVLDNMLSVARTYKDSKSAVLIWNLLWELSSECLDSETASAHVYFDPTIQELRKQAATSYFNCVFQTSKEVVDNDLSSPASTSSCVAEIEIAFLRFEDRLIHLMSDVSYEVRIATLKWLHSFLKSREPLNTRHQSSCEAIMLCLNNINLQDTLMKLLVSEKHHKCLQYILKILYTWNLLEFQDDNQECMEQRYICRMDCISVFQFWERLVSLFRITRHSKTRRTLICCMGMCIKRISSLCISFLTSEFQKIKTNHFSKQFSRFYNCILYFVDLIEQHSDASEPVNMRKAAAESVIASCMLSHAEAIGSLVFGCQTCDENVVSHFEPAEAIRLYARKTLDLWRTCIKLLEDEDVGLRKKLALDVQKCLLSRKPSENGPPSISSRQVEEVIESCFKHLSTVFGHWLGYLDYLCCWVMSVANNANYVVSGDDLVRRVFDKEIDNHHEEKMLICQICCLQLEDISITEPGEGNSWIKNGARDLLHEWRRRFCQQLIEITKNIGQHGRIDLDRWHWQLQRRLFTTLCEFTCNLCFIKLHFKRWTSGYRVQVI
ncbi:thyroid adenoma-associated protein [Dorcoceras hygrometricum]|uniref:Thyroid adenoma-associated protein n=1 Tax=Dorcoceras hygrometricum TaxID=472368 RepID=A0A2Z7CG11_9LAMI|nr:thyroid adenoma-associated protein [Dorcoceras hygrometricum]